MFLNNSYIPLALRMFMVLLLLLPASLSHAERALQTPCAGKIDRLKVFSPELETTYLVDVWTPGDYGSDPSKKYPVIYMNDGQNAFDPKGSFAGVAWDVDDAVTRLAKTGKAESAIVVGIHCTPNRFGDYSPSKALEDAGITSLMKSKFNARICGDEYLRFVVKTLKPLIDTSYQVRPDLHSTSMMGSSMGGLISLYALCEYPDVFGNAACLSTHWSGALDRSTIPVFPEAVLAYISRNLPNDGLHRLYLDHGTRDLDADYQEWNDKAIAIAKKAGFVEGSTLLTYISQGASHNEYYWKLRVSRPLQFILSPWTSSADIIPADSLSYGGVYDLSGRMIAVSEIQSLPSGIYLVRIDGVLRKIMVGL